MHGGRQDMCNLCTFSILLWTKSYSKKHSLFKRNKRKTLVSGGAHWKLWFPKLEVKPSINTIFKSLWIVLMHIQLEAPGGKVLKEEKTKVPSLWVHCDSVSFLQCTSSRFKGQPLDLDTKSFSCKDIHCLLLLRLLNSYAWCWVLTSDSSTTKTSLFIHSHKWIILFYLMFIHSTNVNWAPTARHWLCQVLEKHQWIKEASFLPLEVSQTRVPACSAVERGRALMGKAGCLPAQVTSKGKMPERSRSYPEKEEGRRVQNCGSGVALLKVTHLRHSRHWIIIE